MAIPAKPTITPPPSPLPVRGENPITFSNNINALVGWYPALTDNLSDSVDWMDLVFTAIECEAVKAEQAATDAQGQVTLAQTARTEAEDARDAAQLAETGAEGFKDGAESAAAAAQSAAGLPSLAGNAGYSLTVNGSENGVSWELVGSAPGEIQIRTSQVEAKWLSMDGSAYLQSTYPDLLSQYPAWAYDLNTLETLPAINGRANGIAFNPGNTRMAVTGAFTTAPARLHVLETSTFTKIATTWTSPVGDGNSVDFSDNGNFLAVASNGSGGNDGLMVLSTADYSTVVAGGSGFGATSVVKFRPGSAHMAISILSTIEIYETTGWTLAATLPGASNFAWSDDGSKIAAMSPGASSLKIYNSDTWTLFDDSVSIAAGTNLNDGAMSWAGKYLSIVHDTTSPYITVVDTDTLSIIKTGSDFGLTSVDNAAFSIDLAFFCIGSPVRYYQLPDFAEVTTGVATMNATEDVGFSAGNKYLASATFASPYYYVNNAKSQTEITLPLIASPAIGTKYKVRSEV